MRFSRSFLFILLALSLFTVAQAMQQNSFKQVENGVRTLGAAKVASPYFSKGTLKLIMQAERPEKLSIESWRRIQSQLSNAAHKCMQEPVGQRSQFCKEFWTAIHL